MAQVLLLQVKLLRRGSLNTGASGWWLSSMFVELRKVGLGCVECGRTSAEWWKTDYVGSCWMGRAVQRR